MGGGGGQGGPNSQQAHDVVTTSMRRNDVASTSFRRLVPTRFLINQCQIITFLFLILQYDIIENSRIELRGIVLPVQVGGLLGGGGGGGGKGYVGPPSHIIEGPVPPPLPPPPHPHSSYAYVKLTIWLVGAGHLSVSWPSGVQLAVFFCSSSSVVLLMP